MKIFKSEYFHFHIINFQISTQYKRKKIALFLYKMVIALIAYKNKRQGTKLSDC